MTRSRLLRLSAALACLLGSGCDYWKNLTGSKTPDRGTLSIQVTDEWTREPLPGASCRQAGRRDSLQVDAHGAYARPDMPTGRYRLTCRAPGYRDREVEVDVRPGAMQHYPVQLGRKAEDWYPDNPERSISLRYSSGSLRFPGRIQLAATPADTSGLFSYEWTALWAGGTETVKNTDTPSLWMQTPDLDGETAEVRFRLQVSAKLGGENYPLAPREETFYFARNKKPEIRIDAPRGKLIKLGCVEANYDYTVLLSAIDPDGGCQSFSIFSKGTTSSLGPLDIRMNSCPFQQPFTFRLAPFPSVPKDAPPLRRQNELLFRAVDDDGAAVEETFSFETFTNSAPRISITPVRPPEILYPHDTLTFRIDAEDTDGTLHGLTLDWDTEDGPVTYPLYLTGSGQYEKQFNRIAWKTPGKHDIVATVTDGCSITSDTLTLQLQENRVPKLTVEDLGYDNISGEYRIKVSATDADSTLGDDWIEIFVNWNSVLSPAKPPSRAKQFQNLVMGHAYSKDHPYDPVEIIVRASDKYAGTTFHTLEIPRSVILGLTSPPPAGAASR